MSTTVKVVESWQDEDGATVIVSSSGLAFRQADDLRTWPIGTLDLWAYHEGRESRGDIKPKALKLAKDAVTAWRVAQRATKVYTDAQDALGDLPDNAADEYRASAENRVERAGRDLALHLVRLQRGRMKLAQLSDLTGLPGAEIESLFGRHLP